MEKGDNGVNRRIITVAGCKGGVGKSVVACALALESGKQGKSVILVDADLGGPNLHTYLGMQAPKYVISDFLSRRFKSIEEIVMDTEHENVRFISSAGNVPSQANIKFAQKIKIMDGIRSLSADLIIIDIGAGSSYDVMDFFSMTEDGILVTTPEPTSIVNSYGFVKNVVYRKFSIAFRQYPLVAELLKRGMNPSINGGISAMQELLGEMATVSPECWFKAKGILERFAPNIIVNMVTSEGDAKLGEKLKIIISKYLSVDARCLGEVVEDPAVRASARRMTPFVKLAPNCKAAHCVRQILQRLNGVTASIGPTTHDAPLTWEHA
ncbi:MAG: MinD/ParA family protein [Candidatus Abyssubacteria bacterium]